MMQEELVRGLENLRSRRIPFALSYDGATGSREYGPPLPEALGLTASCSMPARPLKQP